MTPSGFRQLPRLSISAAASPPGTLQQCKLRDARDHRRKDNMHTLGMGTTGLESCFGPARILESGFCRRRFVKRVGGGGRERHVLGHVDTDAMALADCLPRAAAWSASRPPILSLTRPASLTANSRLRRKSYGCLMPALRRAMSRIRLSSLTLSSIRAATVSRVICGQSTGKRTSDRRRRQCPGG